MRKVDVIVVGSGFAGSILAMILRRLGGSVLMLEKGKHPRFAIGESSTPLANLLLEELAARYNLPDLATFSKWGTWQAAHPEIACGLKRGFTFYKHEFGREVDFADRTQQLLVAASPHDRIADTHWYRPDFDAYLAQQARALGAELIEETSFELKRAEAGWMVSGQSPSGAFSREAGFVIDASGPRGCLFKTLKLDEVDLAAESNLPERQALFAHFRNVARLDFNHAEVPFPVDDAAVHHVFEGGWIWVLRFNNGITSAGVAMDADRAREFRMEEGAEAWERILAKLPTVRRQFQNAVAVIPFHHQARVSFASSKAAGPSWALLPSAAAFIDPLFSTGFVLTLLGISRLAPLFANRQPTAADLVNYDAITRNEFFHTQRLVAAAFRGFSNFGEFAQVARIYFAGAIWSETLRRLGRKAPGFLLADHPVFSELFHHFDDLVRCRNVLQQFDLAGLSDDSRENWHPARAEDLFANASKIPATREEIGTMLSRCGF
jgi:FADH2 O2-dependent halogenase